MGFNSAFKGLMTRVACNEEVKVKVNLNLEQATKVQRGSRGIALLFLQPQR